MAKLIVLITRRQEQVDDVVAAWETIGIEGATFLDAYGVRSYQERAASFEFLPGMSSAFNLLRENQEQAVLLFSVLYDDAQVQTLIEATENVLGDLHAPNTGFLFVINLEWVARKVLVAED